MELLFGISIQRDRDNLINTKVMQMRKYNDIAGPNKEELDEIEKMFNPDKLKNEDLFEEISEDAFYADELLDTSRTKSGYRRKAKAAQSDSKRITDKSACESLSIAALLGMTIEELDLSVRSYNCLKRAGIDTVRDLTQQSVYDIAKVRNLGRKASEEVFGKIHSLGLEFRKTCKYCHTTLTDEELSGGADLCTSCGERVERTLKAKDITLEILPPEISSYTGGYTGFHIYINIKNNTAFPVKLELKECTVFKEGRQHNCESNLTGYSFSEDYVFPNSVKTFAKIWKTSDWVDSNLYYDDYLTIFLKDISGGKVYFYKYNYDEVKKKWYFYDYYELD